MQKEEIYSKYKTAVNNIKHILVTKHLSKIVDEITIPNPSDLDEPMTLTHETSNITFIFSLKPASDLPHVDIRFNHNETVGNFHYSDKGDFITSMKLLCLNKQCGNLEQNKVALRETLIKMHPYFLTTLKGLHGHFCDEHVSIHFEKSKWIPMAYKLVVEIKDPVTNEIEVRLTS